MRQIVEAGDVGVRGHPLDALLQCVELVERRREPGLAAHDADVLGHDVAQRALQAPRALRAPARGALALQQPLHLRARLGDGGGIAPHLGEARHVLGRVGPRDAAVDEQLDERVAAEPVRSVQATRGLADRVQAVDAGAVGVGRDPDAAHGVVRGRRDLDRLLGDVEHLQVDERAVHAGQLGEDLLAGQVRHVEEDAAVRRAPALRDLGVARECDAVARGELHALGVVALHEALAERVAQDPALSAGGLGDERAGGVRGLEDARRVELHELRIPDPAPREGCEAEGVAGVLIAARRGVAPDAGVAAGREDHCVGVDDHGGAVDDVEAVGAEDAAFRDEQTGDVDGVDDGHLQFGGAAHEGALDLEAGVVAGVGGAAVLVRAEEALADPPVGLARERHAPALEILDAARRIAGDRLDDGGIREEVRFAQRVGGVLLPGVLGIHRRERGVDAAGREGGVGVVGAALADCEHLHAALGEFDGGAEAGAARADDEHGGGEESFGAGGARGAGGG